MLAMHKYPRTPHLESSRFQAGDEDLACVAFSEIRGRTIHVEEKLDGANAGLRFDEAGELWLQSRGHFLTGGVREKHFNLFKQWAAAQATTLLPVLEDRYAVYGEWLYAKHTIYYDQLPHYFLVFDVLDTRSGEFLDFAGRQTLLAGTPLVQFPTLYHGPATSLDDLVALAGQSAYKSSRWHESLEQTALERGLDADQVRRETDSSDLMEGLYIYVEEEGRVAERYKWVRASFLNSILDSGTHWLRRPIIPNGLRPGVDLFGALT